jgi:alpha-beta hydrolase superfamily lysophospholipase
MHRILVVAAVVAGAVIVALVATAGILAWRLREERQAKVAEIDAFYLPPAPLPPGAPGDVIRSEPVDAPSGVKAWRILYHSTTFRDRDIAVSALVVVPDRAAPAGGFPVVALAHGTVGMAQVCAPSLTPFTERLDRPSFFEQMIQPFTDAGYAVSATDYQGLGTPGVNPYLVGEDAGRNVLDAARMIRRLDVAPLSDVTFIWGHSQGGQASAFAGQIAPRYAPELRVPGVIAGSPAAELGMLAAEVERTTKRSPLTGIAVMIVRAWSDVYPDAIPSSALTSDAVKRMGIVDRECIDGVLTAFLLKPSPDYIKANALSRPPWDTLIQTNTPGSIATPAPILIFQGGADPLIKPEFTEVLVRNLCAVGDRVRLNLYPGKGHLSVIAPSMPDTLAWMSDRLAGQPPPSSC